MEKLSYSLPVHSHLKSGKQFNVHTNANILADENGRRVWQVYDGNENVTTFFGRSCITSIIIIILK